MSIEFIDGVSGEWRDVTKESEVSIGQRVRYSCHAGEKFGYERCISGPRFMCENSMSSGYTTLFHNGVKQSGLKNIQAFFPVTAKEEKWGVAFDTTPSKNKKLAKVRVFKLDTDSYWFGTKVAGVEATSIAFFKSRASAIRGAKRFCKSIGYEFELVK